MIVTAQVLEDDPTDNPVYATVYAAYLAYNRGVATHRGQSL